MKIIALTGAGISKSAGILTYEEMEKFLNEHIDLNKENTYDDYDYMCEI